MPLLPRGSGYKWSSCIFARVDSGFEAIIQRTTDILHYSLAQASDCGACAY
jgi:hypothetical protein